MRPVWAPATAFKSHLERSGSLAGLRAPFPSDSRSVFDFFVTRRECLVLDSALN